MILFLCGCSTTDTIYYETARSISKDNTITQSACWAAVTEISKGGDSAVKVAAISLAEKCKSESIKLQPPNKNLLGF